MSRERVWREREREREKKRPVCKNEQESKAIDRVRPAQFPCIARSSIDDY